MTYVNQNPSFLYIEGVVYSMGGDIGTELGRSTLHVPRTMFGEVEIGEPILDIACGLGNMDCIWEEYFKFTHLFYNTDSVGTSQ